MADIMKTVDGNILFNSKEELVQIANDMGIAYKTLQKMAPHGTGQKEIDQARKTVEKNRKTLVKGSVPDSLIKIMLGAIDDVDASFDKVTQVGATLPERVLDVVRLVMDTAKKFQPDPMNPKQASGKIAEANQKKLEKVGKNIKVLNQMLKKERKALKKALDAVSNSRNGVSKALEQATKELARKKKNLDKKLIKAVTDTDAAVLKAQKIVQTTDMARAKTQKNLGLG